MSIKIIAGYARVSTEMQVERDSLTNQQEQLARFARLQDREIKLYVDEGVSGKDENRPAFQDLKSDVGSGLIDTVVVTKLDRITRSLKDLLLLLEFFEEHEVSFISITQSFDTSTPMGRFGLALLGNVAQLERELVAERVAADMIERARRGKWNGGVVPFGYTTQTLLRRQYLESLGADSAGPDASDRDIRVAVRRLESDPKAAAEAQSHAVVQAPKPKELFVNEDEALIVREMFALYLRHRSFRAVVHALNSRGTRTRSAQTWAATSVKRILQNPVYAGAIAYNRRKPRGRTSKLRPPSEHVITQASVPAIITSEMFNSVQEAISEAAKVPARSKRSPHLLTGLVYCARCGGRMHGHVGLGRGRRVYRYYRCWTRSAKGPSACSGMSIAIERLDGLVVEKLRQLSVDPVALLETATPQIERFRTEVVPLQEKETSLQVRLRSLDGRAVKLIELYEQALITKKEFVARRSELDSEKRALETELAEVRTELASSELTSFDIDALASLLHNLGQVYDLLEIPEQRQLLKTVLSRVVVDRHDVTCNVWSIPGVVADRDRTGMGSWRPQA